MTEKNFRIETERLILRRYIVSGFFPAHGAVGLEADHLRVGEILV